MSAAEVIAFPAAQSPRQILREWMQTVTGEGVEYDTAELTERAVRRFADDPAMQAACLAYAVRELMPQVANQEFRRLRDETKRDFEDAVARKLARWYENVGGTRHRRVLDMTKPELRFAREQREVRAAGELRAAGFLGELESGLRSNKQSVRQRFSDEEIATVWRRHYDGSSRTPTIPPVS